MLPEYPKHIVERCQRIIAQRRVNAEAEALAHRRELAALLPEAESARARMAKAGVLVVQAALSPEERFRQSLDRIEKDNLAAQARMAEVLRAHGLPPDYLLPRYRCALCSDTGFRGLAPCACLRALLTREMLSELEQQSPLGMCSFEGFSLAYYQGEARETMAGILASCRKWAEGFTQKSPSLLLAGASGLGKTHLSLAMARQVVLGGHGAYYSPVQTLLNSLEAVRFSRRDEAEDTPELEELLASPLLVLDDLGAEFTGPYGLSVLYELINTRLILERPTILNTNLSSAELRERYTDRIASRILGCYQWLPFMGSDVRRQKRARELAESK